MTEELLINASVDGLGDVNKLEKGLDNTSKTTKRVQTEFDKMRLELKAAKGEMLKFNEGTAEYNAALRKAADITGKLKATNDNVKASVKDLGDTTKNVAGAVGGLSGGFQVALASMQLFGIENDSVTRGIAKLQQVMAITSGLATFANAIDNIQDLMLGFKAGAFEANNAVTEISNIGDVSKDAGGNLANLGKEAAVISSNMANAGAATGAAAAATNSATGANTALAASIKSTSGLMDEFNLTLIQGDIALLKSGRDFNSLSHTSNKVINSLGNMTLSEKELIKALKEEEIRLKAVIKETDAKNAAQVKSTATTTADTAAQKC